MRDAPNNTYNNNDIPQIGSPPQFEYSCFPPRRIENVSVSGRRLRRLPGTRVELAPNSEYAPVSEMRLITRDYGNLTQVSKVVT